MKINQIRKLKLSQTKLVLLDLHNNPFFTTRRIEPTDSESETDSDSDSNSEEWTDSDLSLDKQTDSYLRFDEQTDSDSDSDQQTVSDSDQQTKSDSSEHVSFHCIKSAVQRLCRQCGKHAKKCEGKCICRCGEGIVNDCDCESKRIWNKLNLYVEVFIVNGIKVSFDPFAKKASVDKVTNIGRGKPKNREQDVANESRFFVPSLVFDECFELTFDCLKQNCELVLKDCEFVYENGCFFVKTKDWHQYGNHNGFTHCRFYLSSSRLIDSHYLLLKCARRGEGRYFKLYYESSRDRYIIKVKCASTVTLGTSYCE